MKKQFKISMVLLALTTPIIAITNKPIKQTQNLTDFNIKTKDVTENLYRARNALSRVDYDNDASLDYEFEDVIIIIPDIKILDLRGENLSFDDNDSENEDHYMVGLKTDIQLQYEDQIFYQDYILETEETATMKVDLNRLNNPLFLDRNINLNSSDNNNDQMGWDTYFNRDSNFIEVGAINNEGTDWVYSLETITDYLEKDHYFLGTNDENEVRDMVMTYMRMIEPLIINGKVTLKEEDYSEKYEYSRTYNISKKSNNKISVYGQRVNYDKNDYNYDLYYEMRDNLFRSEHLLAEDTLTQKEINNAIPGLSGGAIAGIVVGSIAGAALIGAGGYLIYIKKFA